MNISIISIISRALSSATPLIIAGVGGLFGEKAGITNIGVDGNMLIGAFAAAIGSYYTGSAWMGLLIGVAASTLVALLHAYLCITVKLDHVISGLAINTLASNITVYLLGVLFNNKGNSEIVPQLPTVSIPVLGSIPVIGPVFQNLSLLTLLVLPIVLGAYVLQNKMRFGMRVIASGSNMQAAKVMGVNVAKTQYASVLLGGVCCGLAGAFLSISYMNMFVRNMTAGRGYIAIAAILFGNYKPIGVCLAGLFFGFVDALQIALQGTVDIPGAFVQSLPYVLTIIAVAYVMSCKPRSLRNKLKKERT